MCPILLDCVICTFIRVSVLWNIIDIIILHMSAAMDNDVLSDTECL